MTKAYDKIESFASNTKFSVLLFCSLASIVLMTGGLLWANVLYAQSKYPPRLFEGQLAFSPEKVRSWYAVLESNQTTDLYIQTQFVDFIFIIGLLATIFFLQIIVVKLNTKANWWYNFGVKMSFWGPALATADIWENMVTLAMVYNPTSFAENLAFFASSFTVWKLLWSLLGTTLVIVQYLNILIMRVKK